MIHDKNGANERHLIESGAIPETCVSDAHAQRVARHSPPLDKPSAHTCTHDALYTMYEENIVYWLELLTGIFWGKKNLETLMSIRRQLDLSECNNISHVLF
ncbi:hypothetical protein AVEN_251532-1 [Araneus ventricosus]|uniref:Uncharacterized protein n=1 Tax=Araneus ventricosus TaxID=182803 RepID=A0A4Y2PKB2_ARAVE|nr:hypothetical protein AVEN_251532-1 [Araneus ventricosus]